MKVMKSAHCWGAERCCPCSFEFFCQDVFTSHQQHPHHHQQHPYTEFELRASTCSDLKSKTCSRMHTGQV